MKVLSQKLSLSGANFYNGYKPQITSYDYDAPISESGELTKKYFAMREVILKHRGLQPLPVPVSTPKQRYGNIYMTKVSILKPLLQMGQNGLCSLKNMWYQVKVVPMRFRSKGHSYSSKF